MYIAYSPVFGAWVPNYHNASVLARAMGHSASSCLWMVPGTVDPNN
jgi:hypothetical protein